MEAGGASNLFGMIEEPYTALGEVCLERVDVGKGLIVL
jgi:hypothetical protein